MVKKGLLFVLAMCSFANIVSAKESVYYTNLNGVEMTKAQYNKMVGIYSEQKVTSLTQNEFDRVVNAKIANQNVIYTKAVYDHDTILYEEVVSESEYNNENKYLVCGNGTRSDDQGYFSTSYKKLSASLFDFDDYFLLLTDLHWKIMPACRSYDVYAFRTTHMSYEGVGGTQTYYFSNNTYTNINYTENSAGYKGLNNGAGISMNLTDNTSITGLDLSLSTELEISEYNYTTAHVFVTYQHAQSDLTQDQSKSYTLSAGGLGNVVYYTNNSIWNKYDNMTGIELMTDI